MPDRHRPLRRLHAWLCADGAEQLLIPVAVVLAIVLVHLVARS